MINIIRDIIADSLIGWAFQIMPTKPKKVSLAIWIKLNMLEDNE